MEWIGKVIEHERGERSKCVPAINPREAYNDVFHRSSRPRSTRLPVKRTVDFRFPFGEIDRTSCTLLRL